ncbi:MAG: hypothetical protein NOU37_08580 [Candidatus Brocadiales bacterium]|nr:hypothetical protein [Candidatus Bathyanammoxibius amoris]
MDFDLGQSLRNASKQVLEGCRQIHSSTDHRAARRELRDYITKEFLRKYVPDAYGTERGYIITSGGHSSYELDIIIYDKTKTPLLCRQGNSHVLPVEGVYITAEVHSSLTFEDLERSIGDTERIKKLKKSAYLKPPTPVYRIREFGVLKDYFNIVSHILVYDSPYTMKELTGKLMELNHNRNVLPQHQIDSIFILNKGVIFNYREVELGGKTQFMVLEDTYRAYTDSEDALQLFYLAIMSRLGRVWTHGIDLREYVKIQLEPNVLKHLESNRPENY